MADALPVMHPTAMQTNATSTLPVFTLVNMACSVFDISGLTPVACRRTWPLLSAEEASAGGPVLTRPRAWEGGRLATGTQKTSENVRRSLLGRLRH